MEGGEGGREGEQHGNIKWDTLQSTGVEDSTFFCLVQDNFLTQHVLELQCINAT